MLTANSTLQHGRYRIIRPVAQGGMGAVYEAYDNNLNNRVALKEALLNEPALRRAFEREAQRLDRLRHVALPTVKDHFTEAGGQYLVMEYIDGDDLGKMLKLRKRPFPVADVLKWADGLLDALIYLHRRNPPLVHRDIKPANLKLTPDGQIILLDFGLAKGGLTQQTLAGQSLYGYTPGFAPPEQIEGQGTDERSDLYALGATLYALLSANTPDDPLTRRKYIKRGYPDPLLPINQLNSQVPPHVAQALQQATAIERSHRPTNAAEMRAMLNVPQVPQPIAPDLSTITPTPGQPTTLLTQTPSHTQPVASQVGPVSNVSPSNNNRMPLFLGVIMAAVLLIGVLLGTYVADNGGNDEPVIVLTEPPAPTEVIVVIPDPTETRLPTETQLPTETATETQLPTETATETPLPTEISTETPLPTETATRTPLPTETATETPLPTEVPAAGATRIAQTDGMVQVYVPEGDFEMGSADDDPDAFDDEKPRHAVYLNAFWIDQTEVTNATFSDFLNEEGNQVEGDVTWLTEEGERVLIEQVNGTFEPKNGFTDHPVVEVSWYGANAYCAWAERRLPTEAEWEKAAGGTDGRKYPWGNEVPTGDLANYSGAGANDGYERTSPVGNYPAGASSYGAFDMAGNVGEWVSDNYDSNYYAFSPRQNPVGPLALKTKVFRGGSWFEPAPGIRVRSRGRFNTDFRNFSIGFRCARSP